MKIKSIIASKVARKFRAAVGIECAFGGLTHTTARKVEVCFVVRVHLTRADGH